MPARLRLHQLSGGSIGPGCSLLRFFIGKETFSFSQSDLTFIWDKCYHLILCLDLMEPNWKCLVERCCLRANVARLKVMAPHQWWLWWRSSISFVSNPMMIIWKWKWSCNVGLRDNLMKIPTQILTQIKPNYFKLGRTQVWLGTVARLRPAQSSSFELLHHCWVG